MATINYLPIPPRVWSRVQNECSVSRGLENNANYAIFDYRRQSLLKGNILQYKKNSSNLTKKQRYSQIAKGMWTNRTTTWATQSDSYTNPNTNSLKRVNFTTIDPSNNIYSNPPNPFFAYGCPINSPIKEGGTLICSTTVNPCTDVVTSQTLSQKLCNPTTDSDVPGPIMPLCWNDGDPTWYPRQRYTMGTSGNKWPVNAKIITGAIIPNPPVLVSVTVESFSVFLQWESGNNDCYPVQEFFIYDNDKIIKRVPFPSLSATVTDVFNCVLNTFYITAVISGRQSDPSNSITELIQFRYGPTITSVSSTCDGEILLTWVMSDVNCLDTTSYYIYDADTSVEVGETIELFFSVPSATTTDCKSYSYYVVAKFVDGTVSANSNTVTVNQNPCPPVLSSGNITETSVDIIWTNPSSTCQIESYNLYEGVSTLVANIPYVATDPYTYTYTYQFPNTIYSFYVRSVGTVNKSSESNTVNNLLIIAPSGTYTTTTPDDEYTVVTFTGNGSINIISTGVNRFYYLVVGGGGAGNISDGAPEKGGGGGGGGGVLQGFLDIANSGIIELVVGAGGTNNLNGLNSTISYPNNNMIEAIGGGCGGEYYGAPPGNGGSGGGGGGGPATGSDPATPIPGGSGVAGQGFNGGAGGFDVAADFQSGGGGGGASQVGQSVISVDGGNGGNGIASNQTPVLLVYPSTIFWGGGGGGGGQLGGVGGAGGGGKGADYSQPASDGVINTGGGGGGGFAGQFKGGNGGSGVVVIAYLTPKLST